MEAFAADNVNDFFAIRTRLITAWAAHRAAGGPPIPGALGDISTALAVKMSPKAG
jgi:hypothetical protein